jgi:microcystin-dependent protein
MDIIPIGTIVAYGGPLTDADKANLKAIGWLPCDGSLLKKRDYIDLALTINANYGGAGGLNGTFNLPDLRGRFVRGLNHSANNDPDASARQASNPGGNTGNNIGSLQSYATARPVNPFKTSDDGLHNHNVPHAPINNNAYAIAGGHYGLWNSGSVNTDPAGKHTHTVVGGFNLESRPINRYVNYIIKFQGLNDL